jgi:hypothetical protein
MARRSGSMSGKWKRGMARLVRHRQPKGPATAWPRLIYRATSRLYFFFLLFFFSIVFPIEPLRLESLESKGFLSV